ncbi:MAG: hypothetical protein QW291_02830 [Thermofilaceae archaeon]
MFNVGFNDSRSLKVALVAHCILNQNTVARGLAIAPGLLSSVVRVLESLNYGVVQLPCPETLYSGLLRWWQTKEQYESIGYRLHCRKLARNVTVLSGELTRCGVRIEAVIGLRGSPSCAVSEVSVGWHGGDPLKAEPRNRVSGMGIFMYELKRRLEKIGVKPIFIDIERKTLDRSVSEMIKALTQS